MKLTEEVKRMQQLAGILSEVNLVKNFKRGDKVEINNREGFKELVGRVGTVAGTDEKEGIVYVDFGEKLVGDGFSSHNCDGLLKADTGLVFQDRGWISSKIDPRFDVRNLKKI